MTTSIRRKPVAAQRAGFTLIELLFTAIVVGFLMSVALAPVGRSIARSRMDRAAAVVAADLEVGFSLAQRQRKPVRLTWASGSGTYTFTDRANGTVYLRRVLVGRGSDFGVQSAAFSAPTVDFFPNGLASAPDTVTVTAAGYSRRLTMTRAGYVRVVPQ